MAAGKNNNEKRSKRMFLIAISGVLNGLFSVMETAVKRLISLKSGTWVQRGIKGVVRRVHFQRTKEHPPKTDSTRRKTDCFV